MACGRQLSDRFYLRRSKSIQIGPSFGELSGLFDNLLLDFERRLTTEVFDLNRTLSALSSEVRRTAVIENVPDLVFEHTLKASMGGARVAGARTVQELLDVVPMHALVRKHYTRDFCACLPLSRATCNIPASCLLDLPTKPFFPNFSAEKQELFVALRQAPFSDKFVEVLSPYPGCGPRINEEEYGVMSLRCGDTDFVFAPMAKSDGDDEGDNGADSHVVQLLGIRKDDFGVAAKPGAPNIGDMLLVRGHLYKVRGLTGGGMPSEVYGGADLLVFDKPFPFNARKAIGRHCLPVLIRAKNGFLPAAALADFELVRFTFSSTAAAKKLGMAGEA